MKTGATVAAFARPVRLRPVDRRSTPCPSPIACRTSSLAVQTLRRKLRRTRPERSAWPEPEPTSSGPWQPREPMLPDDRDFGPARPVSPNASAFCSAASSRLRRRVEPATAIAGTLRTGPHDRGNLLRQTKMGWIDGPRNAPALSPTGPASRSPRGLWRSPSAFRTSAACNRISVPVPDCRSADGGIQQVCR